MDPAIRFVIKMQESGPATSTTSTSSTTSTTITTASGADRSGGGIDSSEDDLVGTDSGVVLEAPDGSGIRAAARGLQANFDGGIYGEVRAVSSLSAVDVQAEYNMAVEVIRASWGWMVLLGLLVGYSIISGLDRRRGGLDT